MDITIKKRSVRIGNHVTSVSLEGAFWQYLQDIAQKRGVSMAHLIALCDEHFAQNPGNSNFSAFIRTQLLHHARGLENIF